MKKKTCRFCFLAVSALILAAVLPAPLLFGAQPSPVVLELFTSEGCSSCPPADQILEKLIRENNGTTHSAIIGLSFHVDYWNKLGWKDKWSKPEYTARQNGYSRLMKLSSIYTPQIIIDGVLENVGSKETWIREQIAKRRQIAKIPVKLELRQNPDSTSFTLTISIEADPSHRKASSELLLAITLDETSSQVGSGENAGRTLRHANVVQKLISLGAVSVNTELPLTKHITIKMPVGSEPANAIVFMQANETAEILGAGQIKIR